MVKRGGAQMLKRTRVGFVLLGLLIATLVFGVSLFAQDGLSKPIYSGRLDEAMRWSVDSQRFVFHNDDDSRQAFVRLAASAWLQHDVATDTLTQHTIWPLQPALTQTELQLFNPTKIPDGRETFLFSSRLMAACLRMRLQ